MRKSTKSIILADDKITDGVIVKLNINSKTKYFLSTPNQLFIIEQFSPDGSALINNLLVSSPRLYTVSQFDPLFLIIPNLLSKSESFRDINDILQESSLSFIQFPLETSKICDEKTHEASVYIRLNQDLLNKWVLSKINSAQQQIYRDIPWVSQSNDRVSNARKLSLALVSQFLPYSVVCSVDSKYTLDQVLDSGRPFTKRIDNEPTNASLKRQAKPKAKQIETPKLPRGQTTLSFFKVTK